MKKTLIWALLIAFSASICAAATPTIYFTDLTSGPVGSIVTAYGANLQGSATVNGTTATMIKSSSTKVSFAVPNTTSGPIVVGGSNAVPFTVRAGRIYFVATSGSDSTAGSQSAPWASIPHAFNTAACGDVIYAMSGVVQTGLDNYRASLSVQRKCSEAMPLALVGYPGATVTIGSASGQEFGIRNPDINGDGFDGMVFANLIIRGGNTGIKDVNNSYWRLVGNDFSCPNGGGQAACVQLDYASYVKFLGNSIHDTGAGGTKYYHSFYATTDSLHVEVGWNHIYNNQSCRGVQFYSTGGSPQYDLIVHDNVISGQLCDGINFSTVDATKGPVVAYNNLVFHVGLGGANLNTPNEACIASLGYGSPGGQALIYGNTFADCGSAGGSTAGAITVLTGSPTVDLRSNLVLQNPGEPIYSPNTNVSLIAGSHNVLLSNGTAGVVDSNYQPMSGGAAIGAGTAYPGIMYDLAGKTRPQSGSEDAGAYLYGSAAPPSGPTLTLSPASLAYGSVTVGTTSSAQPVTLTNSGSAALLISSITLAGTNANQFRISNNCGASVAAGQSCTIQAEFSPSVAGAMNASIAVVTNASNPTSTVSLSGTGAAATAAVISITPSTINFGNQTVNTISVAQTVVLKNAGTGTLSVTGIALSGANGSAFKLTSACSATLAPGATCAVQVQFAPTVASVLSAVLTFSGNASNSPVSTSLAGTGVAASNPSGTTSVHYSVNNLYFYNRAVGSTSAPSVITVTNRGKANFTITGLTLSGAQATSFAASSTCVGIAPGQACTINVTMTPRIVGTNAATLTVLSNAPTQLIPLTGHGF